MYLVDGTKIKITRGDIVSINISAQNGDGSNYIFQIGDIIRFKIYEKKNYNVLKLQKDINVTEETEYVSIFLDKEETKIDELINKPKEYWYEVELNPDTAPQTIIGYDDDGAKILILYPEGCDFNE